MRLAGISSIDQANQYLRESDFIATHNQRFAVLPAQGGNAHRIVEKQELEAHFLLKTKIVGYGLREDGYHRENIVKGE